MASLLALDDEPNIRLLYEEEFKDEGYDIKTAATIGEAKEIYQLFKPDLLIVDIRLQDESGISFLEQIREKNKEVLIVVSSAYEDYKQDFHVWASDAYVVKQPDLTELKTTIRDLLAKKGKL